MEFLSHFIHFIHFIHISHSYPPSYRTSNIFHVFTTPYTPIDNQYKNLENELEASKFSPSIGEHVQEGRGGGRILEDAR